MRYPGPEQLDLPSFVAVTWSLHSKNWIILKHTISSSCDPIRKTLCLKPIQHWEKAKSMRQSWDPKTQKSPNCFWSRTSISNFLSRHPHIHIYLFIIFICVCKYYWSSNISFLKPSGLSDTSQGLYAPHSRDRWLKGANIYSGRKTVLNKNIFFNWKMFRIDSVS